MQVSVPSQALASLLRYSFKGEIPEATADLYKFQCLHRLWPLCYLSVRWPGPHQGSSQGFSAFTGFGLSATIIAEDWEGVYIPEVSVPSQALASLLRTL